ncbi:TIGR02391 family protein [Streptomyces sp. NPDC048723]|uniref:TIGR02391 family protein n=1 Tax=Streptomyces sp. NPDC048723 TaxID=3365589 RepID=UPI003715F262
MTRVFAPDGMPRPLGDKGHELLEVVWQHLVDRSAWPALEVVDRVLYDSDIRTEDALGELPQDLLWGLDSTRPMHFHSMTSPIGLTFAGAANCLDAGRETKAFIQLLQLAVKLEAGKPPAVSPMGELTSRDVVRLVDPGLLPPTDVLFRAVMLARQETAFAGSQGDADGAWRVRFDRRIRSFADVTTGPMYWRRRDELLSPVIEELPPAPPQVASLLITCSLHPEVSKAAAERLDSGQYADAVMRAFQAVEYRVQNLANSTEIGSRLMGIALGSETPRLVVTRETGPSLPSEREGLRDLFKGAIGGLRNPRAHGPHAEDDPEEAYEMLAFASLLMRRLDIAEQHLTPVDPK